MGREDTGIGKVSMIPYLDLFFYFLFIIIKLYQRLEKILKGNLFFSKYIIQFMENRLNMNFCVCVGIYCIVASRSMSRLVTPHVTTWIWATENKSYLNELKFCELSWNPKSINKMLKISAFYLEKQKSFVPKKTNRNFKKQNFWFP